MDGYFEATVDVHGDSMTVTGSVIDGGYKRSSDQSARADDSERSKAPSTSGFEPTAEAIYRFEVSASSSKDIVSQLRAAVSARLTSLDVGSYRLDTSEPGVLRVLLAANDQVDVNHIFEVLGRDGELRFRPVVGSIPGSIEDFLASTTTSAEGPATMSSGSGQTGFELTPHEGDVADQPVVLAEYDDKGEFVSTYQLGPSAATGKIVSTAAAELSQSGQWSVRLEIRGGRSIDAFNAAAAQCFGRTEACPSGQLAIVLDSRVVSAPTIQQASFERDQIQISGSFSESEAKDLAMLLRSGALPVSLSSQSIRNLHP